MYQIDPKKFLFTLDTTLFFSPAVFIPVPHRMQRDAHNCSSRASATVETNGSATGDRTRRRDRKTRGREKRVGIKKKVRMVFAARSFSTFEISRGDERAIYRRHCVCSTMKHSSLGIQRLAVCVRNPHTEERSGSSNIFVRISRNRRRERAK